MKKLFAASLLALLFLVGCGSNSPEGSTGQLTGKLSVTISGLPNGVDANATVSGPNDFNETLTQTTIINNLALGNYTISAQDVTASGTTYEASVTGSPVNVQAAMTTNAASVSYREVISPPPSKTNHPPIVSLSVITTSAKRGISATASASDPDGDNLTYTWNFGDGTTRVGSSVQIHSYTVSGTYMVKVTVSDGHLSSSDSEAIKVQYLRPVDSPDVVILAFAGRCGVKPLCDPPRDNQSYLDSSDNKTVQAIGTAFYNLGYSVEYGSFAAIVDHVQDNYNDPGLYEAQQTLNQIKQKWIADYDNPTRVVLLAHSHGTVWASILAMDNPDVTFPYFIYLDGVCNHWDLDNIDGMNGNLIARFYNSIGAPYPAILAKYGKGCDSYPVPGLPLQHLKDVVPWNVGIALEVQSDDSHAILPDSIEWSSAVSDKHDNHRPDGSQIGIYWKRFTGEYHDDVKVAGSNAMNWVVNAIYSLGLPNAVNVVKAQSNIDAGIHLISGLKLYQGN